MTHSTKQAKVLQIGSNLRYPRLTPHGNRRDNHPDNLPLMSAPNSTQEPTRARPSIELSPVLSSLLDHISEVTGVTKAGIISGALLDAMPSLLARADALKKGIASWCKFRYKSANKNKTGLRSASTPCKP